MDLRQELIKLLTEASTFLNDYNKSIKIINVHDDGNSVELSIHSGRNYIIEYKEGMPYNCNFLVMRKECPGHQVLLKSGDNLGRLMHY